MNGLMMRTPPLRMTPYPLSVGDSVQFADSRRWWRVRAMSDRYVILTSPFNLPHPSKATVLYSVIDWERGVRGPDDHYGVGYEDDGQIAEAMRRLVAGDIEVSHRAHSIRVRIDKYRTSVVGAGRGGRTDDGTNSELQSGDRSSDSPGAAGSTPGGPTPGAHPVAPSSRPDATPAAPTHAAGVGTTET